MIVGHNIEIVLPFTAAVIKFFVRPAFCAYRAVSQYLAESIVAVLLYDEYAPGAIVLKAVACVSLRVGNNILRVLFIFSKNLW